MALVFLGAACGKSSDASAVARDSTRSDSANGNVAQVYDSASYKAAFDSATKGSITSSDTTIVIDFGRVRTRKDTFTLRAAIRNGMKKIDTWPTGPVPLPGAIMPARRIVAFYGNPLSKRMGALGEFVTKRPSTRDSSGKTVSGGYDTDSLFKRLDKTVKEWNDADPRTPVQPALHLIVSVAQLAPGRDGKYRLRMDSTLIEEVYSWAVRKNALLFLDIQIGQSTVQAEVSRIMPWLLRPNVHLALDPEFSMHYSREGVAPGKKIGIMDAAEINWAIDTLNKIVVERKIPPKVLVIHRFTRQMVSNANKIKLTPGVQVVMDMDGWGQPWLKFDSYSAYTVAEPVQFTGFKIFFGNDSKKGDHYLTAKEVLHLLPRPMYIQYQ
ncbi:MAG TPA: hypothetical protein VFO55_12440 [Gemmatimonadaceae bacterium]|nr:hypothetical protein [Gemmatimonadaceae bacterium]